MALISAIMVTTLFEIEHPCDTSKNGLYHRGMIYSLIDLSQCINIIITVQCRVCSSMMLPIVRDEANYALNYEEVHPSILSIR